MRRVERAFAEAGIVEPRADAAVLVEAATGLTRLARLLDDDGAVGTVAAGTLDGFVARRLAGEPVYRIVGRRPFFGLDLLVTPDVLDPRPDTETLVEALLAASDDRRDAGLSVLDLGTGSGAILCALLSERPRATGIGLDLSLAAGRVAQANLRACGLGDRAMVVAGRWDESLAGSSFDLVASNPPYIETDAIATLDREVRDHDPPLSLDGGDDGLDAYRALCPALPRLLRQGGTAALEVGWTQAAAVAGMVAAAGLSEVATRTDVGGHARVVVGRLSVSAHRAT